jgi:Holliday junction DNA helicase RuvB
VRDHAQVAGEPVVSAAVAAEALALLEVDSAGLDRLDREILRTICQTFKGGPVGLSTLAAGISEEPDTLEDVYEPYLLKLGLIERTPRGRVATVRGWEHIGLEPPSSDSSLY